MRRWVLEQSLSLFFGVLFLGSLIAQAFAGAAAYNDQQRAEGFPTVSVADFVTSANYAVDVAENWQSEYLQFLVFILATVWLVQRGSTESKELGKPGEESDEDQKLGEHVEDESPGLAKVGGWRTAVYSRSLGIVMGVVFLATWAAQALAGWVSYNEERLGRFQDPLSWSSYLVGSDFWNRSLQNWQSEFLAVGTMVTFSVFLRERGSAQSKPVGEAHQTTGASG
jgi:hypothetical protein